MFLFRANNTTAKQDFEIGNKLAEVCFQLDKLRTTSRTVHIQLYPLNDHVFKTLINLFGYKVTKLIAGAFSPIFSRFMIGMAYMHSRDSGYLEMQLGTDIPIRINGKNNSKSKKIMKEIAALFADNRNLTGGKIWKYSIHRLKQGASLHYGASMPNGGTDSSASTDLLGRPRGFQNVHIIDSSVLPEIPGTPTTFIAMANALRIVGNVIKQKE